MSKQTRITSGTPQPTFKMTGTDASQGLTASELIHNSNAERPPVNAMITVEDYNLRYTAGGVDASLTLGHPTKPGDVIYLECHYSIETFRFINAVVGEDAIIMVTIGF